MIARRIAGRSEVATAEHVGHGVVAGLLVARPQRRPDRAASEEAAVLGLVSKLDALDRAGEDDRVLADDGAAAQGREADVAGRRAPVWPSRERTARSFSAIARPAAAASPRSSAVPEGASTFIR